MCVSYSEPFNNANSETKALVKWLMTVDDSLTQVTIINYHELSCAARSNGKNSH